jgi:glycosyltransferase involved in cell wall biosynthesis
MHGENILLAKDAGAFAQATIRLLTDRELNGRLRADGRAWVEERYAWQKVYQQVDRVYAELIGTGGQG